MYYDLYVMMERLDRRGHLTEIIGDDKNSELVVDGVKVGLVRDDKVMLY